MHLAAKNGGCSQQFRRKAIASLALPQLLGIVGTIPIAIAAALATPVLAQAEFKVMDRAVLTLRVPEGSTVERAEAIERRFEAILDRESLSDLVVTTSGNAEAAELLLNGELLVEVSAEDAAANATGQAIALADLWADRLQAILNQPEVRSRLLATANMPQQLNFGGQTYLIQGEPAADLGRFVTDGTRIQNRVIFWQANSGDRTRPNPMPAEIYLLNGSLQFVPYRAY